MDLNTQGGWRWLVTRAGQVAGHRWKTRRNHTRREDNRGRKHRSRPDSRVHPNKTGNRGKRSETWKKVETQNQNTRNTTFKHKFPTRMTSQPEITQKTITTITPWYVCLPAEIWSCLFGVPENSKVTLSGSSGGEVRINGLSVCARGWNMAYSHRACQEQVNCSQAVSFEKGTSEPDGDYYHVRCEDHHHRLSQCSRIKGECLDGPVSVYCVGKNMSSGPPEPRNVTLNVNLGKHCCSLLISMNLNLFFLQVISISEPQKIVGVWLKSIIEISGKKCVTMDYPLNWRRICVGSLTVVITMTGSRWEEAQR